MRQQTNWKSQQSCYEWRFASQFKSSTQKSEGDGAVIGADHISTSLEASAKLPILNYLLYFLDTDSKEKMFYPRKILSSSK